MAGHSKWSNIKFRKRSQDDKRSKIFNKISSEIIQAVDSKDSIENNAKLKNIINKALSLNMPKKNIEKAIERGKLNYQLEEKIIEAFYSNGIALLIHYEIGNNKKIYNEIKNFLLKNQCSIAKKNSFHYIFKKAYETIIDKSKKNELEKIHDKLNIHNIEYLKNHIKIILEIDNIHHIKSILKKENIEIVKIELKFIQKNNIYLSETDKKNFVIFLNNIMQIKGIKKIFFNTDINS